MTKTTLRQIDEFLGLKRIALVGVSRNPKEFSAALWNEFRQRRFDAVPVNPAATELDGKPCYPTVQAIQPPVEGVLIMTPPSESEKVVRDCAAAGVKRVWLYGGATRGSFSAAALKAAEENGIDVIYGQCPYMFFQDTPVFHRWHAGWKKLTGKYPAASRN